MTDMDRAADEVIKEAEEDTAPEPKKRKVACADAELLKAAMCRPRAARTSSPSPGPSREDDIQTEDVCGMPSRNITTSKGKQQIMSC